MLTGVLLLSWFLPAQSDPPVEVLVITNVNVVDTRAGEIQPHMTVVIKNGRIDSMARVGMIGFSRHTHLVNATNKYLIPGLWDMHVHSAGGSGVPWNEKVIFPLYIANGITGIRDMGGDLKILKERKSRIERGEVVGPNMVISGPFLDGGKAEEYSLSANTPEEARAAVDKVKAEGMDFVKILSRLPREAYFAVAEESRKQHIPFAGHVPESIGAAEASDAGQRSIEHVVDVMMSCSREESELRKQRLEARRQRDNKSYHAAGMRSLETYDHGTAAALFAKFKKNDTWQVPTLVWWKVQSELDSASASDTRLSYVPASIRKEWDPAKIKQETPADLVADLKKAVSGYSELTGNLDRAKVPILAGTDSPDPYDFPGFSLHEELELLVKAGLTAREALRSATYNPALFLDKLSQYGVVEKTRVADLVLLDADPLTDIRNTRSIAGVIRAGKYYPREELDKMLAQAAEAAARDQVTSAH
jgi:imidazolonepropionase-like amidohydrolase